MFLSFTKEGFLEQASRCRSQETLLWCNWKVFNYNLLNKCKMTMPPKSNLFPRREMEKVVEIGTFLAWPNRSHLSQHNWLLRHCPFSSSSTSSEARERNEVLVKVASLKQPHLLLESQSEIPPCFLSKNLKLRTIDQYKIWGKWKYEEKSFTWMFKIPTLNLSQSITTRIYYLYCIRFKRFILSHPPWRVPSRYPREKSFIRRNNENLGQTDLVKLGQTLGSPMWFIPNIFKLSRILNKVSWYNTIPIAQGSIFILKFNSEYMLFLLRRLGSRDMLHVLL